MNKIILTAIMAFTFLYVGLVDLSYAEDRAKSITELTEAELAQENSPINLDERKIEQDADDSYEKDREDDVVEDEDEGEIKDKADDDRPEEEGEIKDKADDDRPE